MRKGMGRWATLGLTLLLVGALAGCSARADKTSAHSPSEGQKENAAPQPLPKGEFKVLLNGTEVTFKAAKKPHEHEPGKVYVPAEEMAKLLGASVQVNAKQKERFTVNGKDVNVTPGTIGIHQHEGAYFAPVKELAAAVGYTVEVDQTSYTVKLRKK